MQTGPEFCEEHTLRDGTRVTFRHIRPEDSAELERGFQRLSAESRHRRFLGALTSLTEEQLRYLTCVDGQNHVAIVAVLRTPGVEGEQGLGVARFVRAADDPTVAEAAITVTDEMQGKGLGRLLGLTLARAAAERGVKCFRGEILGDNAAVQALLTDVGAAVHKEPGAVQFDVSIEGAESLPPGDAPGEPPSRLDVAARKLLRAAATFLAGLFRYRAT